MTDYDKILDFIEKHENFHVVLDNDMFFLYPTELPEEATDEEADEWYDSGITFYAPPERLLLLALIDYLGGTSENV